MWAERLSGRVLPTGSVRLLPKGRIEALPGFDEGAWWVQDAAASLPARLLGDVAGKRVADLCAAPGGKTAQLALAGASVVAVDISKTRLGMLAENLARLGLAAEPRARPTPRLAARRTVRRRAARRALLIDRHHPPAPRHPLHSSRRRTSWRSPRLQARLLDNAARLLKPGGRLVYSTCSLEPEEGEAQIAALLVRNEALSLDPIGPDEVFGQEEWIEPSGALEDFSL